MIKPSCPICSSGHCPEVAQHQRWSAPIYRCGECLHGFVTDSHAEDEPDEFNTNRMRADFYASLLYPLGIRSLADVGTPRDFYFLSKYRERVPNCKCIAVDLYDKPHPDYVTLVKAVSEIRVDLCTAFHVLEHVTDARQFVSELEQNSKSFIIEVPHCESLEHIVISSGQPHIHFFSKQSFERLFADINCHTQVRIGDDMPSDRSVLVASRLPVRIPNNVALAATGSVFGSTNGSLIGRVIKRVRRAVAERQHAPILSSQERIGLGVGEDDSRLLNDETCIKLSHVAAFTKLGSNAGDILLPTVLQDSVVQQTGGVNWNLVQVRDEVTDSSIDAINSSAGLIIGGGGLFLCDTNANDLSGWQWPCPLESLTRVQVPICLMAVGYNRFRDQEEFKPVFRKHLRTLAQKSVFIGLRNNGSIRAIHSYLPPELHKKIRFHPCLTTVLSKLYPTMFEEPVGESFISLNCAFDRPHLRYRNSMKDILGSIAAAVQRVAQQFELGIKYYSHYSADEEMIGILREHGVEFDVVDLSSLGARGIIDAYRRPALAMGMRGHSQMIPFGCQTPILSLISHDKLQWFLDDIDQPRWGVDLHQPGIESQIVERASNILQNSDDTVHAIARTQSRLWEICSANNDEFLKHTHTHSV